MPTRRDEKRAESETLPLFDARANGAAPDALDALLASAEAGSVRAPFPGPAARDEAPPLSLEGRLEEDVVGWLGRDPAQALGEAERLIGEFRDRPEPYVYGALAALLCTDSERCLRMLRRLHKRFEPSPVDHALEALALLMRRQTLAAQRVLRRLGTSDPMELVLLLPVRGPAIWRLVRDLFESDEPAHPATRPRAKSAKAARASTRAAAPVATGKPEPTARSRADAAPGVPTEPRPALAESVPELRVALRLPEPAAIAELLDAQADTDSQAWFQLRGELAELSLVEGFDELLCLPTLRGVDHYWYQVETARKVLKQFKGRVLLADEVGLGKTIEAGMVLKEYALRGMAERVLIVAPPSLVGQWQEELASKFELQFATTNDPLFRSDPESFWKLPRVIASLAAARREEHAAWLAAGPALDLVIVDEAHRLKDRKTRSYQLVHGLRTRFLLLLSATPVQNDLIELYNLLTLLQPGIFRTEREFRSSYMTRGSERTPRNRHALRALLREVMIRNTRALVDVRLPPRQALTLRVEPGPQESACYRELCDALAATHAQGSPRARLGLRQLLHAAGSSPSAAASALEQRASDAPLFAELASRYRALGAGAKEHALLELLEKNPHEKKLVFVAHLATLAQLSRLLERRGIAHARFEGSLSSAAKDAAIEEFRERVPVLLCSESGGEGRNLQFCNTVIHFDLPWNPLAIEQRIGRVHRIGQTREVFVFNLAARYTVEDALLAILDEKLSMFELVVGEVDAILGELDQELDFSELVYRAWVESTPAERERSLEPLGEQLLRARGAYESTRALDEELFADELEVG